MREEVVERGGWSAVTKYFPTGERWREKKRRASICKLTRFLMSWSTLSCICTGKNIRRYKYWGEKILEGLEPECGECVEKMNRENDGRVGGSGEKFDRYSRVFWFCTNFKFSYNTSLCFYTLHAIMTKNRNEKLKFRLLLNVVSLVICWFASCVRM